MDRSGSDKFLIAGAVLVPIAVIGALVLTIYFCCTKRYHLNWWERSLIEEATASEERQHLHPSQPPPSYPPPHFIEQSLPKACLLSQTVSPISDKRLATGAGARFSEPYLGQYSLQQPQQPQPQLQQQQQHTEREKQRRRQQQQQQQAYLRGAKSEQLSGSCRRTVSTEHAGSPAIPQCPNPASFRISPSSQLLAEMSLLLKRSARECLIDASEHGPVSATPAGRFSLYLVQGK